MIVKDESAVIARCLRAVRPLIDSWVIVDTGSTDGTQRLVRELYADLPGELFERPFRGFGASRTDAIELARGRADYLLVLDADDLVDAPAGFSFGPLGADAYTLRIINGELEYDRVQLIRSDKPFRYDGVLHEFVNCSVPFTTARIDDLRYRCTHDGARSRNPHKYKDDAAILEAALLDDPGNARNVFYLAQSYRDAGIQDRALFNYLRRSVMGGWEEEAWYAQFEVARRKEALAMPRDEVTAAYLKAHERRPTRAESLCELARFCREQGSYSLAHVFASAAARIPRPADLLFVDGATYRWRVLDELAISAFYVGRHEEAIAANMRILTEDRAPASSVERVRANLQFSVDAMRGRRAESPS